jgi:hypothetical protein
MGTRQRGAWLVVAGACLAGQSASSQAAGSLAGSSAGTTSQAAVVRRARFTDIANVLEKAK